MGKIFCDNCGCVLDKDAKYCRFCGAGTESYENDYIQEPQVCIYGPPAITKKYECTVCGHIWSVFYDFGENSRRDVECPKCKNHKCTKVIEEM